MYVRHIFSSLQNEMCLRTHAHLFEDACAWVPIGRQWREERLARRTQRRHAASNSNLNMEFEFQKWSVYYKKGTLKNAREFIECLLVIWYFIFFFIFFFWIFNAFRGSAAVACWSRFWKPPSVRHRSVNWITSLRVKATV